MSKTLTLRTRLDSLKKDAKAWLKAVRAGDDGARARFAAAWPKAPAEPGLRDIQHALALDYGQPNWKALTAALDEMAVSRLSHGTRVETVLNHGWSGDPATAQRILRRHPEVAKDSLFIAATCGDLEAVRRFLARDPQAATRIGGARQWTALAYVAYGRLDEANAVEIARDLLRAGADPNFGFDDGWGCPFKIVTGILGKGEGAKSIHAQAEALLDVLIEAGADPFDTQALYNTSIAEDDVHWTEVLWRHCEARELTEPWRKPAIGLNGRFGVTALDYLLGNAVGSNHIRRTTWLLDHGAHPDAVHSYTGHPVLTVARLSGFGEVAALLEKRGAKPVPLEGLQAFQAACLADDQAGARQLATADPALLADSGPLLTAAMLGRADAVDLLLSLGARPEAEDADGIRPLHRAIQSGDGETVDRLLAAGADPNARERKWGGTALSWAVVLGQPHLFDRLAAVSTDLGALANAGQVERLDAVLAADPGFLARQTRPDSDRPGPLFCLPDDEDAAIQVARILLRHGADRKMRNKHGQTSADFAEARGLDEAADVIRAAGG